MQEKDFGMYNPVESSTSRHLSCSHELCDLGTGCKSPKQPCPYTVNYYSENTSSSGLLVEDILYLATSGEHTLIKAPVIIGYVKITPNLMVNLIIRVGSLDSVFCHAIFSFLLILLIVFVNILVC